MDGGAAKAGDGAGREPLLGRALAFARPQRVTVLAILVLTVLAAAVGALEPLVLKELFDALSGAPPAFALEPLVLLVLVALGRETVAGLANVLTWRLRLGVHHELLAQTVGKLHSMPLRMQRSEGVGAILTRLDRSIQGFLGAVTQVLFQVLPSIAYLAIALLLMVRLEWRLAVVVLLFAPVPAWIAVRAAPEQVERERTLLEAWARIYGRFNEVLSGIVTVRSFAMEDHEKGRFLREVGRANRIVVRGVGIDTGTGAAANIVVATARIAVLAVGAWLVLRGEVGVGTLVAFLGYVGGVFAPVQGLTGAYGALQRARVSLEQVFQIVDLQEFLGDAPEALEPPDLRGEVRFEDVHFEYPTDGRRPVLHGVDLVVRPGEQLAIVGPSGSGKTTLVALLMRFYDPVRGRILVDGHDLRALKQGALRRAIGVVLQDALLFNDSVRDNIAYGRPNATDAQVEQAARAARAHDFILRLPEGYRTKVGERGSLLSVGERQRIAVARALVKDPRIVVLDEATSALDVDTQAEVQEALRTLTSGRTTFVIAHRLETVAGADRIVVLEEGRIVEQGRHAELCASGGYYARLVERQARGLLRNEGE